MSERNIYFLLQDIYESIQNIFTFTKGYDFIKYENDLKTIHAVEHNFMIIGEAVARLPESFKLNNPSINWRLVKDFRNVIVHDYFGIDNTIVWEIITMSLADLAEQIKTLMNQQESD